MTYVLFTAWAKPHLLRPQLQNVFRTCEYAFAMLDLFCAPHDFARSFSLSPRMDIR